MSDFNYFDAFGNMLLNSFSDEVPKTISKEDYEIFCKEFTFEKLKDKSFGEAFCEKFDIEDYFLSHFTDETAKYHIEKLGYIK